MPALNFQKQFAEAVENGRKTQTIRAPRKRPVQAGEKLYLYTGMRTKACRKLSEATCVAAWPIEIAETGIRVDSNREMDDPNAFARRDGFACWSEMRDWFRKTHGLPFVGDLIVWNAIEST